MNKKETRQLFSLRLTPSERKIIELKASESGMKISEFIRNAALKVSTPLEKPPRSSKSSLPQINLQAYRQLVGIANNLNQITRSWNLALKCGYSPNLDPKKFEELRELLKQIAHQLTQTKR